MHSNSSNKLDKAMTAEQFTQVVDAILAGKYSWACVLILRYAGYNPLHYIPYRTYNRLMKENNPAQLQKQRDDRNQPPACHEKTTCQNHTERIKDLAYLEQFSESHSSVRGGDRFIPAFSWLDWGKD